MSLLLTAALQYAKMKSVPRELVKDAKDHHEVYQIVDQWLKEQKTKQNEERRVIKRFNTAQQEREKKTKW